MNGPLFILIVYYMCTMWSHFPRHIRIKSNFDTFFLHVVCRVGRRDVRFFAWILASVHTYGFYARVPVWRVKTRTCLFWSHSRVHTYGFTTHFVPVPCCVYSMCSAFINAWYTLLEIVSRRVEQNILISHFGGRLAVA